METEKDWVHLSYRVAIWLMEKFEERLKEEGREKSEVIRELMYQYIHKAPMPPPSLEEEDEKLVRAFLALKSAKDSVEDFRAPLRGMMKAILLKKKK